MKKTLTLALIAVMALLQSCTKIETVANKDIDTALKNTIKAKNDSLIKALITSNLPIFKALGSDNFVKNLQANTRNVSSFYRKHFFTKEYTVFDEYHITDSKTGSKNDILSASHGYTFTFVNDEKESYLSLLKVSNYQFDFVIAVTYGRSGNGWKIYELDNFFIGNCGKTVYDLYNLAKQNEGKGFLLDAFVYAGAANDCLNGEDVKFKWTNEKSIKLYLKTIENKVAQKYSFPIALNRINSKPLITGIEARVIASGVVPAITYQTSFSLKDTLNLKKENEAIKKEIRSIFKDLDSHTTIVYRAQPVSGSPDGSYDLIDKKEK